MTKAELIRNIRRKSSFLCVGLDTLPEKIPGIFKTERDPVFAFNKAVIDATHEFAVAYKPNLAFYEAQGLKGWESLAATAEYLKQVPEILTIADAKRGDIGNTSDQYAKAFFHELGFDAVTVAPYMGEDSVSPFLAHPGKWTILLGLTSNSGASDFQLSVHENRSLFSRVFEKGKQWGTPDNLMFVAGATRPEMLAEIRKIVPDFFLLVPGVGAQGGNLGEVAKYGLNKEVGLLVNASRSILYPGGDEPFPEGCKKEAKAMAAEMKILLEQFA